MKCFIITALVIVLSVALSLFWSCSPEIPKTPEDTQEYLAARGLHYEGKWVGPGEGIHHGYHLKPVGDNRSWDDVVNVTILSKSPRHVVFVQLPPNFHPSPDDTQFGKYILLGDKAEIEKIIQVVYGER